MKQAVAEGADVAVELHADYQYEPSIIDLLAACPIIGTLGIGF